MLSGGAAWPATPIYGTLADVSSHLRIDHLEPHPRRLSPDHRSRDEILRRHHEAVAAGCPVYQDPTSGLSVFTAQFLAQRRSCCNSACRHCPYLPL